MKYACLIASLCACFSCLMFPMGYKPRVPHRPSTTHAHKPQPSQHLDEELESAIEASLQEQALYNAARQQATMSFIHITQGDIPFDDALAMAMAASLETQQPELEPAMPRKKESAQPKHNSIKGDEACPICASTVEELGIDQARFTHCCHQFICKNDAQELEKRSSELYTNMQDTEWRKRYAESPDFTGWPYALQDIEQHRHAECPFCRHYPLEIELPAKSEVQHSGNRAPRQGAQELSRQTGIHQEITDDIINLFFKFLDTVITKAVHDRNVEALRLLQQELTPWGSYEQFQTLIHTILCVRPEMKLHEHEIIKAIWENIIHSIPTIEREQLALEDTMQALSQYERRYQILATDSIGSLLGTWQAHLGDKGLHVWNMLNPTQKLFYMYRLKFQCQLVDIIEHIA